MPPLSADCVELERHLRSHCDDRTRTYEAHVQRLEEAIALIDKATLARFAWIEDRTKEVEAELARRLGTMDTLRERIEKELRDFAEFKSKLEGNANMAMWFAGSGLLIGLVNIFMRMNAK